MKILERKKRPTMRPPSTKDGGDERAEAILVLYEPAAKDILKKTLAIMRTIEISVTDYLEVISRHARRSGPKPRQDSKDHSNK